MSYPFHSAAPKITLINYFNAPYENAVATARTCYSPQIVTVEEVARKPKLRDKLAESIYQAGHHTTLQHAHLQFALSNVSRQFIWSFLHAHPFYNSEQVSQRYVKSGDMNNVLIPPLEGECLSIYIAAIKKQVDAYREINVLLQPTVEEHYYELFPARMPKNRKSHQLAKRIIPKKTQEIGRYVLPVATFAHLYHTISAITLLRYYRLCQQVDVPTETHYILSEMVRLLLEVDPHFAKIIEPPLRKEETIEHHYLGNLPNRAMKEFVIEFDKSLEGYSSKLISSDPSNEELLANGVREVLGLAQREMSNEEAIGLVLDPRLNNYLGESLNLTTISKLTRAMVHPHYTFRKKLSHTADSQNQRHRMTPASRPSLRAYLHEEPSYITPSLLKYAPIAASQRYHDAMTETWTAIHHLISLGVKEEWCAYLLPNAVAIRFTESADLLSLHHKLKMRLCYNAQEEIFRASQEEALQIQEVNPIIGNYLGAPCALRHAAQIRPYCPEGERYCGVPVWKLPVREYKRVL